MAVDQEILVAVQRRTDHQLELSNINPAYQDFSCDLSQIR